MWDLSFGQFSPEDSLKNTNKKKVEKRKFKYATQQINHYGTV